MSDQATDEELIAGLTAEGHRTRHDAKHALLARGSAAVPAMGRALLTIDPDAFRAVAELLGRLAPHLREPAVVTARQRVFEVARAAAASAAKKGDDDWGPARPSALNLLAGLSMGDSIEVLTDALHDPSIGVRGAACCALAEVAPDLREHARQRAAGVLIGILAAPAPPTATMDEPNLRPAAAMALGRLRSVEAVPHLIEALADKNYLCVCAATALGILNDPRAVEPLIDVLRDARKFWVPRGNAAVVLGHMGPQRALAAVATLRDALMWPTTTIDETWDERCIDGVRDALNHLEGGDTRCLLEGQGYRFEMW